MPHLHLAERWRDGAVIALLLAALYLGTGALTIQAKAALAPVLIKRAWSETLAALGTIARPWPWADTWPVARLRLPAHGIDLPVLFGDSGNALAFAPGHASASAPLGSAGLAVIGGHRDTHFRFLADVEIGDALRLQLPDGLWRDYRITAHSIADVRVDSLSADAGGVALLLVTCFPFDAIAPNGPLRYVVRAEPV